jgi:hypothetical protein
MKTSTRWLVGIAVLAGLGFAYERHGRPPSEKELEALRKKRRALEAEVTKRIASDLRAAPEADVVIGVPAPLAERLAGEMIRALAPEIRVNARDLTVEQEGEVRGKILIGKSRLGTFDARVKLERVEARLRLGRPRLRFVRDRAQLSVPVTLVQGHGAGRLDARWDGRGLAGAVCGDMTITGHVGGKAVPATYTLEGDFRLEARGPNLVARPEKGDVKLKVRMDPDKKTWQTVDDAMGKRNAVCRGAMAVADVREKVRSLVNRGFPITLPRTLFPTVRFPAALSTEEADIRPKAVTVDRGMLWYGAEVALKPRPAAATPEPPPEPTAEPTEEPTPEPAAPEAAPEESAPLEPEPAAAPDAPAPEATEPG